MSTNADLLAHARDVVERSARALAELRLRLQVSTASSGPQHRLIVEGAVHDLARRHETLLGLYRAMEGAEPERLPGVWQDFFACYDGFLDALRQARTSMARAESLARHKPDDGTPPAQGE
ncbi:hypothetical protein [Vulcaniibacterium gelatinicum]|uniref:hypothetical protein n=1 Tax=Vulcaniibacterium gelatinicum TaxID=2598725 RepID=UPI0011CB5C9D|nr:hypothetical protein [Vulcaniibacterium gelatinicum]